MIWLQKLHAYIYISIYHYISLYIIYLKEKSISISHLQIGRASLLLVGDEIMGLQQRHDGIHVLQKNWTCWTSAMVLGASQRCNKGIQYGYSSNLENPMKTYENIWKPQIPANHVKVEQTQLRSVEHGWILQKCSPAQTYQHTQYGGSPPTFPAPSLQRSRHPCRGHHGGTARHSESSPTWELAMASSAVHQNGHPNYGSVGKTDRLWIMNMMNIYQPSNLGIPHFPTQLVTRLHANWM